LKSAYCCLVAYDNIIVFPDYFKNHILPDKIHMLNVSFMVPSLRREFGGCAGNIAYNLNLLMDDIAVPMGTVGKDFQPYADWMDKNRINRQRVRVIDTVFTAQAYITTDLDDNQITAFHSGAMEFAHHNKIVNKDDIVIGVIAPDGREGMLQHAARFHDLGIPFIFDPGQGMPMFGGEELKDFIHQADWITVNDYEWQLMQKYTGYNAGEVAEQVRALVVTLGGQGSIIYAAGREYKIPVVQVDHLQDPTGCGDAFRAGLMYGLLKDMDWETMGRVASLMGAIKIASHGNQNHSFTLDEFQAKFKETFNRTI